MATTPATPPDGGWGWWVVLGAFVINLLTAGSSWAYGVLYVALLDALQATKAETALVGSLVYMVLVFMAPYASAACRRYGHRRVIITGGATASIAIMGSSFATSINQLYYTYGLLTGFGYGCCLIPSFLITQEYFKKRMGIAMGIGMAGGGLGMCVMALLTQQLLNNYGWRGSLLILGAINANLCVAGALMRPVSHVNKSRTNRAKSLGYIDIKTVSHKDGKSIPMIKRLQRKYSLSVVATYTRPVEDTNISNTDSTAQDHVSNERPVFDLMEDENRESGLYDIKEENEEIEQKDESRLKQQTNEFHQSSNTNVASSKEMSSEPDDEFNKRGKSNCCRYPAMVYKFFDSVYNFSLFKDPVYVLFQVSVLIGFMGMSIVTTHVVKRALDFGISPEYAASLLYGMGIGQTIGRTLGGVAVDHMPFNKIAMTVVLLILGGIATDVSIFATMYIGQQVTIFLTGFMFGAVAVLSFGVLVDTFGAKLLSYTISVCYLVGGIGTVIGPTLAGYLRDKYGSYDNSFHLAAAADVVCGLMMLAMIPYIAWRRRRHRTHEPIGNEEEPAVNHCKEVETAETEDVV
ncbi:monocarboxylate transporter 9-like [Amphiura filiformis]|uniref:monocarboxylate transporter 9-like n=1 Tax=Amphiura filiformis TaxID=82378 RepID=UPI003B22644C